MDYHDYNGGLTHQENSRFSARAWNEFIGRNDFDIIDWATIGPVQYAQFRGSGVPNFFGSFQLTTGKPYNGTTDSYYGVYAKAQIVYFTNLTGATIDVTLPFGEPDCELWMNAGWFNNAQLYTAGVIQPGGNLFRLSPTDTAVYLFPKGAIINIDAGTPNVFFGQKAPFVFVKDHTNEGNDAEKDAFICPWYGEYYHVNAYLPLVDPPPVQAFVMLPNSPLMAGGYEVLFVDQVTQNPNKMFISGVFTALTNYQLRPAVQFYGKKFIPRMSSVLDTTGDWITVEP